MIQKLKKKEIIIHKFKSNLQYCVTGYKVPKQNHPDAYPLEVLQAILAKGQSGILFDEVRNKRGLTYDVGVYFSPGHSYGIFAFYTSASKDKIKNIQEIYQTSLQKITTLPQAIIQESKTYLQGNCILHHEDTAEYADYLCQTVLTDTSTLTTEYIKNIQTVTKKDLLRVIKKYLLNKGITILLD